MPKRKSSSSCSSSCCKTIRQTSAAKRFSKLHPWTTHGAARLPRGSEFTRAQFGPSWYEADDQQKNARLESGYRGRGKYWGKTLGGALGSIGGMFLGGPKGAVVGGSLGSAIGDKLTGKGLYEGRGLYEGGGTVSNSLMAGSSRTPAQFASVNDETGALIVSHREYISDIFGNEANESYKNRTFPINPGLERSFPWLSQIAQNYEEYEMIQCVYEFRSTVSIDVGSNGQVGSVVMATNYNAANRPFDDKNTMMQYDGSMSCKTTESMVHGVECDPSKKNSPGGLYTRANPVIVGQDLKTYDHGLFQLATIGLPAAYENDNIGELWVSYTVKLRKPRFFSGKGLNVSRDLLLCNVDGTSSSSDNFQNLAGSWALGQQNNIGCIVRSVDEQAAYSYYQIVFPASYAGNLSITFIMSGSKNSNNCPLFQANSSDGTPIDLYGTAQGTTGNITVLKDIYGCLPGTSRVATFGNFSYQDRGGITADTIICLVHVKVSVATDGVDNALGFLLYNGSDGLTPKTQISIDISEYNTYDAAPTSTPTYVNNVSGLVIDPTV